MAEPRPVEQIADGIRWTGDHARLKAEITTALAAERAAREAAERERDEANAKWTNTATERDQAWEQQQALEDKLAAAEAERARLREALRRAHSCATGRDGGTCDGCFVSEALRATPTPPEESLE